MTIKRRLFISNTLMLIIPILLSGTIVSVMMFVITNMFGIQDIRGDNFQFYHAAGQIRDLAETWPQDIGIEQMKADLDAFGKNYGNESTSLAVYQNGTLQYEVGSFKNNPYESFILSEEGEHYYSMDRTGIFKTEKGEYTILLVDIKFQSGNRFNNDAYYQYLSNIVLFMSIVVIVMIVLTNRLLTRMVIRKIITPLDTLVYGVHQIQDGNLSYRIAYEGKDEFAAVCSDFNEMARHLMKMVDTIQKNDENRRELIAGISHDLRTPLTAIKAYVEGLEKGIASTPHIQKRYLDTIRGKTDDLEHIVSQLFLFSKLDVGEFPLQMEQFRLSPQLAEFFKAVSDEYSRRGLHIVLTETAPEETIVNADKVQLRSVLTNILENSLKYSDKEHSVVCVSCRADEFNVSIRLTDNGPGVPEDAIEKLFNVFYRSDKARSNTSQGSGLGLAIAAKIMERLGGSIMAENAPRGGLSITLTLPIVKGGDGHEENPDY